jgi:hypothetical protein
VKHLVLVFLSGCVLSPQLRILPGIVAGAYCASTHAQDAMSMPSPDGEISVGSYSKHAVETARTIGALPLLQKLHAAIEANNRSEVTELRLELNDAITIAMLNVDSMVAHLSCEEERAHQAASALRVAEGDQVRNLTIWSIVVSAVAAVVSGFFVIFDKDPLPSGVVAIAGGASGAALGGSTFAVHRTIDYGTPQNVLAEFIIGTPHPSFPEPIWRYVTHAEFTPSGEKSFREWLLIAWNAAGRANKRPTTYDAELLEGRAAMIGQIRQAVQLMSHELQNLAAEAAARLRG